MNSMANKIGCIAFVLTAFAISVITWWVYWQFYVVQIFNPSSELVADPLYFMSIIFGVSGSILGITTLLSLPLITYVWYKQAEITLTPQPMKMRYFTLRNIKKFFLIVAIIGGGFSFVSNIILLHKIIPDNGYVLCPKKIGYKKNLLRDYVLDVSQCEKF
ncbi:MULTISPECIES: DUF1240 domain-containing protein [Vibrio]|uniref:DUF1240 domain-containing protein n=1 Tax=Vibrio TaxID=662 RepID=UPI0004468F57|nr:MULTISPECIES: DUF1240 domain-containing protein [Vibrio]ETZ11714.1 hypothetical protein AJ90_20200 [Vibrio parahaemolyticus M0605]MBD6963913.1 DUF1240 domain-containing protein [Vibrio parahaemolyticus]CAD7797379.1 hypothetical protein ACOMICROBIO_NCLOACGD_00178 [Vibrio sp. B1ASS3]CAD7800131.1 hypothetical protein ACOMICROBIO_NCLOACGD_00649 [Vibrio sp. B1ASS3]CAD7826371.1 hypothetical protein ACOMICROBIO_NCLOACGD_05017 [Vibrio sp. B1ASS3]